jgi:cell volume regulation protein A
MASLLGASGTGWAAVGHGVAEFLLEMAIGLAFGAAGGCLLPRLARLTDLPSPALYPVQTIAFGLALYGLTAVAHGSGFLAVFLAGILSADSEVPRKQDVHRFAAALAGLSEIVAFVVLGLSVNLSSLLGSARIWTGIGLAALLFLVIRPALVGLVLLPVRLERNERIFVLLAGLKGAVPILLGTYALLQHAPRAGEIYQLIFVVVLLSVIAQGALVPTLVARLRPTQPGRHNPQRGTDRRYVA